VISSHRLLGKASIRSLEYGTPDMDAYSPDAARDVSREAATRAAERAVDAFRRGDVVSIIDAEGRIFRAVSVEAPGADVINRLRGSLAGGVPVLAVTGRRAEALGLGAVEARALFLSGASGLDMDEATALADPTSDLLVDPNGIRVAAGPEDVAEAVVELARAARLLPAGLVVPSTEAGDIPPIDAADVGVFRAAARRLTKLIDAHVPVEATENTHVVAFRPGDGGTEHLAVIVGSPDTDEPVLIRLHSECFTGDFLGSLRCDCGMQLRGAIKAIEEAGGGILLYLAQEGRGIGLINKLRAYKLQDLGFDTVDANEMLGFDADERVYAPAAEMLRQLGVASVRLLTNNPDKARELARHGVVVVERVPHAFAPTRHNARYLATKAARSGHLF